jgi:hypothetical protein
MAGAGFKDFFVGEILTSADVDQYLMQQTVMVFADASARTTALTGVLAEGMVSYLKDTNTVEVYDGSAWVSTTGDITSILAGTGITVTNPTSATPTVGIDTAVVPRLGNANTFTAQNIFNAAGTTTVDLIVRGTASQTADAIQIQDSGSNNFLTMSVFGGISTNLNGAYPGRVSVGTGGASTVGLVVRGSASQSANLTEWQESDAAARSYVDANGRFVIRSAATPAASLTVASYGAPSVIPVVVRGAASQSANLQEWQSSAGTVLSFIRNDGLIQTSAGILASGSSIWAGSFIAGTTFSSVALSATTIGAVIRGAASQTADLQIWQNNSGTVLSRVDNNGNFFGSVVSVGATGISSGNLRVVASGSSVIPAVIRGAASQSANLTEWQNSAGTVLSSINSNGVYTGLVLTTNGFIRLAEENSGGKMRMTRATAAATNPGANLAEIYFRDGTNAGTLKLVVRAGTAGAETTVLDNIPT